MSAGRRLGFVSPNAPLLAAWVGLWVVLAAGAAHAQSLEYPVKANYLVRFAAFVDWPGSAFASPGSPIVICVAGRDPFGRRLDEAVAGQLISGRRVLARRVSSAEARSGCHIVYLGGLEAAARRELLAALASRPVLTVTDAADPAVRGLIDFAIARDRVRFHIDNDAARDAGLAVNSRLLSLALTVRGGRS
ncbi:YfiR family protein [Brevundimonas lutea]|uniref:YfiR family protein n=1 Tax=Brevundimonas lutea TaxID=2293980 RepID=UPI000F0142DF|nr:YfiR family protein [Brevundimonas lutea]